MPEEKLKEKGPHQVRGNHLGLHDGPHPPLFSPQSLGRREPPLPGPRLPRVQNPSPLEVHPQSPLNAM